MNKEEVIVIGAGPCGLAAAVACKERGIDALVIEKGCIVNSVYQYPTFLRFHSTPELLEIGGVPFVTPNEKPTRQEGLQYYTTVVQRKGIRVHTYETVTVLNRVEQGFALTTEDRFGNKKVYTARYVILATGYFGQPNALDVPGEHLPKVSHYFREAHPYVGRKVAIVGGRNSAVDAALELVRVGAEVTVIYRKSELSASVKAWVKPIFESMINKGKIRMMWNTVVKEIEEYALIVEENGKEQRIENEDVLILTGFHPDRSFLAMAGVNMDEATGAPIFNADTMETDIAGLYIAGVISAGNQTNEIFIENGRLHGAHIAAHIASMK